MCSFAIWNTMMGTSILSIPWGIKQVCVLILYYYYKCSILSLFHLGSVCMIETFVDLQAGFTLGIIIIILMGLITLYCCYRVLKSPKSIRKPALLWIIVIMHCSHSYMHENVSSVWNIKQKQWFYQASVRRKVFFITFANLVINKFSG